METLRDERERQGVGVEIEPLTTQTDGKMTSLLLIVAWNRPDLWDLWRRWFVGVEEVQVVLDQRRGERRQRGNVHEPERRRVDYVNDMALFCDRNFADALTPRMNVRQVLLDLAKGHLPLRVLDLFGSDHKADS